MSEAQATGAGSRPAEASVIAIDIGGTKIAGSLVMLRRGTGGQPDAPMLGPLVRVPTEASSGGKVVVSNVLRVIEAVRSRAADVDSGANEKVLEIAGIGISAAGIPDEAGTIVSATDLIRGWAGTHLGEDVSRETGLPVTVIGDVHAHALGESRWGAGRLSEVTLLAAAGTGIGGAVCVGGRILRGAHGVGGHVGHVSVAAAGSQDCSCGRKGHVEPIASGSGIVSEYRQVCEASGRTFAHDIGGAEISQRAAQGEKEAGLVVRTAGMSLGTVLGSLANVVDPDTVILSGSVTAAGDLWWESLRDGYQRSAMDIVADVPLVRGRLGDDAPLIGAAEAFADMSGAIGPKKTIWINQKR
jgi:glucokinase